MKLSYADKKDVHIKGLKGLPENYPVPYDQDGMMFYIQRNQNFNTVIYQINVSPQGVLQLDKPLNVYWKEYARSGGVRKINYLQEKLAYGYTHSIINEDTFQVQIVSYPRFKMILTKVEGEYKMLGKFNGQWAILTNIYVFANDLGAFPDVKYIELYGDGQSDGMPCYEKIIISA